MTTECLENALRLGAATLHEAQSRTGDLPAAIRPVWQGARLAAPAYTVQVTPGNNLLIHRAVYEAPSGSVLVVATGGPEGYDWGYWGDILTAAAQQRGLAGLVIDGCVRDVAAIQALGFPLFARGTAIRGTTKSPQGHCGQPVLIGHVWVHLGDLLVADGDGAVVVPQAHISEVLTAAEERANKEAGIIKRIAAGESTLSIYSF